MTNRQQKFVEFYTACGNASEAARRAGYKGAVDRTGHKLLRKAEIREKIEQKSKQSSSKRIATAKEIKEFFTNVMNDPDAKPADKLRAGELLGKCKGMFLDRVQVSTPSKVVILPPGEDEHLE